MRMRNAYLNSTGTYLQFGVYLFKLLIDFLNNVNTPPLFNASKFCIFAKYNIFHLL